MFFAMKWLLIALIVAAGCAGPANEGDVEIKAMATTFADGNPTIAVGESVTFVMVEQSHTVDFAEETAEIPGLSSSHSGNLNEGDTFTVTFTEPGTYRYYCQYHSSISGGERLGMVGVITVQ